MVVGAVLRGSLIRSNEGGGDRSSPTPFSQPARYSGLVSKKAVKIDFAGKFASTLELGGVRLRIRYKSLVCNYFSCA